ncbi:MAG TPA: hypothetical protein VKQ08_07815 [Cyclobacteriaceae bacterium]|nr:hypothetical protein [Cyclobacteriaceae bacterium]
MKPFRLLLTVLSLGVIFSFSGCSGGGGAAESTPDKQFGMLSAKTWTASTVTLNGVDQSSTWTGFKLKISGTKGASTFSYNTTTGTRPALGPWPAGNNIGGLGTWAFGTDPVTQITRDPGAANDELPMTYTVTATTLTISFNYTGAGYAARVSNLSGNWVFNFN